MFLNFTEISWQLQKPMYQNTTNVLYKLDIHSYLLKSFSPLSDIIPLLVVIEHSQKFCKNDAMLKFFIFLHK